jgi:stress-induced morphogen
MRECVTQKAVRAKLKRRVDSEREKSGMPMDARDIESMIKAAIPDAEVTIRDLAGDGDHYAATVISESFRGKSRVQQHQIVYQSLRGQMGGVLHALALQTGVPD